MFLGLGLALLLTACGGPSNPPAPTPDNQAPTIIVSGPTTSFTSAQETTIIADAQDNVGVIAVEFYLDGTLQKRVTTSPYKLTLNQLTVGTHTLYAKAFDQAGNVTSSSPITLTVTRPTTPLNGKIEQDRVLTADQSPYVVNEDLIIAPGVTLTLNPGVEITGEPAQGGFGTLPVITVHGTFRGQGTPSQPVVVNLVRFNPSYESVNGAALTTFENAVITNTELFNWITAPRAKSTLNIQNSVIEYTPDFKRDTTLGGIGNTSVVMKGNIIRGAQLNCYNDCEFTNNHISGDGPLVVFTETRPRFFNNTIVGGENSVVAATPLIPGEPQTISIPPNYWGTTDLNVIDRMIRDGKDDYGQSWFTELHGILSAPHPDTPNP